MDAVFIILIGKPGSGKGTQAKLLQEKFKLDYIGSGDLLRERSKKNDFTGKKISQVINKGKRVPTPVIFKLWMDQFERLKKKSNFKGLILDGSPRTLIEAEMIEEALNWFEWKQKKVILIDISSKTALKRLSLRRSCLKCGRIFANLSRRIKKSPCCKEPLILRSDDTPEGIKERLRWFEKEVKPVINFYEKRKELQKVNGEKTIEEVFKEILNVLNYEKK